MRIDLPGKWADIKISDFVRIQAIAADKSFDEEYDDPALCEFERFLHIVACLAGQDVSEIKKLDMTGLGRIREALDFVWHPETMDMRLPRRFRHNRRYYRLITDVRQLSGGEYIDLSELTKGGKTNQNLHRLMAIFAQPCTWYGSPRVKDTEIVEAEMMSLPVTIAYPVCVFFCKNLENLLLVTQAYLETELTETMGELREMITDATGDGLSSSTG